MTQATEFRTYELPVQYDARNSFYGKAQVIVTTSHRETVIELKSYDTIVAKIIKPNNNDEPRIEAYGTYNLTTLRHIKEFVRQEVGYIGTKSNIIRDFFKVG